MPLIFNKAAYALYIQYYTLASCTMVLGTGRWESRETVLLGETRLPGMVGEASLKHMPPSNHQTREGHGTIQASGCTQSTVASLFAPTRTVKGHTRNNDTNERVTTHTVKHILTSFSFSTSASFCRVSSLFSYNNGEITYTNEGIALTAKDTMLAFLALVRASPSEESWSSFSVESLWDNCTGDWIMSRCVAKG